MRLLSSLIQLRLTIWAHMTFCHLGSFWSMDLAELLHASISAGGDLVTCVSSGVICQFWGWGFRCFRDTESSCICFVTPA